MVKRYENDFLDDEIHLDEPFKYLNKRGRKAKKKLLDIGR